ncbi:21661_t:CDS:2 [Dentiscutata erythropus]|uniref:21661_t:CDS:1 n=1 Tax=Dentiscutata erythropus TaxID=1348616 RepID=A0A9N8ZML7_9GLOM|nr:21661_t:CDS:2 [Dentiscutata erythropus]
MGYIRKLCESQEQPFPWLREIPWGNEENQLFSNPYWLHQDYKNAEDYYYHVYEESKLAKSSFASYLETVQLEKVDPSYLEMMRSGVETISNAASNATEAIQKEEKVAAYLTKEIDTMDVSPKYKEIIKMLLSNSNSLIQFLKDNEVDELLIKSVIVHLLILHASIPSDASPLAAYLHQLQVCENDFILTCPSDVEGVVMNTVASFRNEDGAGSGVTRYRCKCGEIFIVLDCGSFSNPEERAPEKYSISSKCLKCKGVIGYGSIEGEYTRLDAKKITSVEIKHDPGYIVEQISTEKTHNVRMMTPQAYRILHLFVHTLLGASIPSSIASKFFAKNGNNAGDTMEHCLNNIRNDWKILKEIFHCNDEQLALIHSIISSLIKESTSDEWRLDTPEKREEWEDEFSRDHDISNVIIEVQDIRIKMSKDRISETEEEIDDMLSARIQNIIMRNYLDSGERSKM